MSTLPISKRKTWVPIALQAAINSGIVQGLTTFSLAKIGITRCCIETAVLLLRRFHPTIQGQNPPQFHTQYCPIQGKFPEHIILPRYPLCTPFKKSLLRTLYPNIGFHIPSWMADVLEVLNPTNAESAKRSTLYKSATTFSGLAPETGQEVHIQKYCSNCVSLKHSKDSCRSGHYWKGPPHSSTYGRPIFTSIILLSLPSSASCYGCPRKGGRMFTPKGRVISGDSVERQFYTDVYISRARSALCSLFLSLP